MKSIFVPFVCVLSFQAAAESDRLADLQYYLCDKPHAVRDALDLKKSDAEERQVYLFETSKLDLFQLGWQIRLRVKDKKSNISIKRFDLTEAQFVREQKETDGKCEMDVHGKGQIHVLSCSKDSKLSNDDAKKLISGEMKLADALSEAQRRALFDEGIDLSKLNSKVKALGPIESRAWDFESVDIDDGLALEQQTLPDGTRYIEFSVKTKSSKLSKEISAAERLFQAKGLSLCPDQTGQREGKLQALLKQ